MKRARDSQQKEVRRNKIMDEAWRQYVRLGYDTVTMSGIASAVGLAKGTLYLYFPTKESLYLSVLSHEFERWFEETAGRLESLVQSAPASGDPGHLASLIASSFASRLPLVQLLAESHVILEQNSHEQTVVAYKRMLAGGMQRLSLPLSVVLGLDGGESERSRLQSLLLAIYAAVIGLRSMSRQSPEVERVIKGDPELSIFQIDFESSLQEAIELLLRGAKQLPVETGKETA